MAETEEVGIVIKNRLGDDVTYYGVETVTFDTTVEGEQQTFTKGVLVEEGFEINPNFADGNHTEDVPEGYLTKKVIVKIPENLKEENIAEGVEVAGLVGTHSGGGELDLEGDFLKYVAYQLDDENKEIIICGILYSQLYADTGKYDVNIPANFGAYSVVIYSKGVV